MLKKWCLLFVFTTGIVTTYSQNNPADTSIKPIDSILDTTVLDYDEIFSDFDAFMDSILSPHSFFMASVSGGRGFYNFKATRGGDIETRKKLAYTPLLGYYHKNGLGFTASGSIVNDNDRMNFYQLSLTPSYDYLSDRRLAAGVSFTKYFTSDSLSFYTTPLQNEIYAYFTYRKWWVRPSISANWGWGSRTDYRERESLIQDLRLRRDGFTYINTKESISDFSLTLSARHDFYWLDIFTYKDHIRISPMLAFTSGTQKFGFNQSVNTYATLLRSGSNILFSSENVYLDDELKFQPLSSSFYLRAEYSIGKFFLQPQFLLDYYFPAKENNLNALFSVNLGVIL